ncbi:hypothetical protein [Macrococcus carouselicus]|uniref:Uncharacterized protein n=1 Tax=Macrococcus carouselicus TaxID=69969 RepID=A0A9Q8FQR4_9STAP|nr:hypothetical protein [Macrococcus carouselicus]TDM04072.1 hypothetical protein ERX40_02570 [Macrococcus carouselicus]
MYKLIFTDENKNIIHSELCDSIRLSNQLADIEITNTKGTQSFIGAIPENYHIFNSNLDVKAINDETLKESLNKELFNIEEIKEKDIEILELKQKIETLEGAILELMETVL